MAASLILFSFNGICQMTLDHSYTGSSSDFAKIVNLSLSGKKIAVYNGMSKVFNFYNLDYSLWKTITLPTLSGGSFPSSWQNGNFTNVYYPSETLFNTDTFLEVAIMYFPNIGNSKLLIVNENSNVVDSIPDVVIQWDNSFTVYSTANNQFRAVVQNSNGTSIYNLPGTIPCELCGNGLGVAKNQKSRDGISEPIPNPSSGQVKITFQLPQDVKDGEIEIFNTNGQKIKSYKVDNAFGYIMVDNSILPSGIYYYNLISNGNITSTKKMVVFK